MTIIYVPFDTDIFWTFLFLETLFWIVAAIIEYGSRLRGINPNC